ncbi:zinc finger protein RFP-like [Elgaria multicarinata webbii]|uniref:zinc finger protein RFP-like n=1 Tax=Elgaria multicarinata webbii TaxID=159646 RepID=UPI002FCD057E
MAAGGLIKDLCEEATCPICLDYFKDPVSTDCGHSFCRACLTQGCGKTDAETSCPQCRETVQRRSLRPNRQLANFVEITMQLSCQGGKMTEEKRGVCDKHQEPLKLFCKEDEIPMCEECGRSKISLEKASQAYKAEICSQVKILKKKRREMLAYKADAENEMQDTLKQTKAEREKTVVQFRRLRQLLEIQEKLLLAQIEEVEEEIARRREEHQARLSQELSSLECLIREMEEKCQQPASELLQDWKNTLRRSEVKQTYEKPLVFPPELKWMIWGVSDITSYVVAVMKQFKDALLSGLQLQKVNVTLDPNTAHPQLLLCKDRKSVTYGDIRQPLPDGPERFDTYPAVLGCEGFTAGRHFWEVVVGSEERWAVGVASKSVRRKGNVPFSPEEGIWAVEKWEKGYQASNSFLNYPPVTPRENPKRIRVSLNCAGGQVAFFDADTAALLYTFMEASFSGKTLHPFFWLLGEKAHLRIS